MKIHHTHDYLINPLHKVTVDVIGIGGTGSRVLTNLASMNEALMGVGHPGLHVRAWDPDIITPANLGRQAFSPADLNINKAVVLITRINRHFGYEWEACPTTYTTAIKSNITITCVDTAVARIRIGKMLSRKSKKPIPTDNAFYWMDLGNLQKTGQVVLGTLQTIYGLNNGKDAKRVLPTVVQKFRQLARIKEDKQGPSCSLAEALEKQDLFINSSLAQFGVGLLWKLIREKSIRYHGCYVNLETLTVNPIKI